MRIQFWHVIVLLLVILLLFGSSKLPDLARSVGKSMKILKSEVRDLRDDSPGTTPPPGPDGGPSTGAGRAEPRPGDVADRPAPDPSSHDAGPRDR